MPQSAFFCLFKLKRITLQYCVGFYQTSTWISHRFTYVPSHWRSAPLRITIAHLFMAPEGGENTLVKGRRMFSLEAQWDSALLATLLLLLNSATEAWEQPEASHTQMSMPVLQQNFIYNRRQWAGVSPWVIFAGSLFCVVHVGSWNFRLHT